MDLYFNAIKINQSHVAKKKTKAIIAHKLKSQLKDKLLSMTVKNPHSEGKIT
jgi:hypothetical protein